MDHPIAIVGAGIGGLVAALALAQRGIPVRVYEQAAALKDVGAGLQLSANGTRVLIALGLGPVLAPWVATPAGKEIRLYNTGQTWKLFDLGEESVQRYGAPYWMVHRNDLHRVLADAVANTPGSELLLDHRLADFQILDDSIELHFANGQRTRAIALIGADGVHSVVRAHLAESRPATYTGIMVWRAMVPTGRLPHGLRRPVGTNWVGPGGHVITYPIRHGQLMNVVAAVERPDWKIESWSQRGDKSECMADLEGWHSEVLTLIRSADELFKWALIGREPLRRWSDGAATLLGDAAHPTLPMLAQGANMAIEDGMVLARCIENFPNDIPTALRAYEAMRVQRTSMIVTRSKKAADRFHNPALADSATAAKYIDHEWAPSKVIERYEWLFEYDALKQPIPFDSSEMISLLKEKV